MIQLAAASLGTESEPECLRLVHSWRFFVTGIATKRRVVLD
jgi:hypothetical protein